MNQSARVCISLCVCLCVCLQTRATASTALVVVSNVWKAGVYVDSKSARPRTTQSVALTQ